MVLPATRGVPSGFFAPTSPAGPWHTAAIILSAFAKSSKRRLSSASAAKSIIVPWPPGRTMASKPWACISLSGAEFLSSSIMSGHLATDASSRLVGSRGTAPPLGLATVMARPAFARVRYGTAISSSHTPVFLPLGRESALVVTRSMFFCAFICMLVVYVVHGLAALQNCAARKLPCC